MSKNRKILEKALASSKNLRFGELIALLEAFGFVLKRIKGSHRIFHHPKILRAFPIQEHKGKAKPYQVRQLLELVEQYNLQLDEDEDDQ